MLLFLQRVCSFEETALSGEGQTTEEVLVDQLQAMEDPENVESAPEEITEPCRLSPVEGTALESLGEEMHPIVAIQRTIGTG